MSILRVRRPMLVAALMGLSLAAAGCDLSGSGEAAGGMHSAPSQGSSGGAQPALQPSAVLKTNIARGATDVPVDRLVEVSAQNGRLTSVAVSSKSGSIAGR